MGKLINLSEVSPDLLPGPVLVLLSKYSQALHKHDGIIIKVSSMNVFKHVEQTGKDTKNPIVFKLYRRLLIEVNKQLNLRRMQTHKERRSLDLKYQNSESSNSLFSSHLN